MNVYDITSGGYGSCQVHSVVANSMAEAERIYLSKYKLTTIKSITLHSQYVQIQGIDGSPIEGEEL